MTAQFNTDDLRRFATLLRGGRNFVVTCHLSPDGDALGSSLGLKCVLSALNPGAHVTVVTPDESTRSLSFLPGYDGIMPYSRYGRRVENLIADADVVVCLDFNKLDRIDLLAPSVAASQAAKLLVDHHLDPGDFADVIFSYPQKCATCMLLYQVLVAAGLDDYVTRDAAECLLAGMMTDTGDFSYNVADSEIYSVIGRLIEHGADKARLTRLLFNTLTESSLRIQGYAMSQRMTIYPQYHAACITLTLDELNAMHYAKGDTEGLVNKPLAIPGVLYSAFLRQEAEYIKVSMRSLGDFPVNRLCSEYFGGGGHLNAAGGEYYGTMQQCVAQFEALLQQNNTDYIESSLLNKQILDEEKTL